MEGAVLALYPAKRVASDDMEAHPFGYYLEKKGELPANWTVLDERNQKKDSDCQMDRRKDANGMGGCRQAIIFSRK